MGAFMQRNPLVVVLGGVAVLLLLVVGFETGWGLKLRASIASPPPGKVAVVDARLLPAIGEAAPEQAYPETGSRPLFTPTRRPAPVAEAQGTMVKGQYVLQGVTIVGDTRIAMLKEKAGPRVFRVEKGRDVNGITVAEIERDRVTLRQGGDSETVALTVQRSAAAPPTPGAPVPPGTVSTPPVAGTGPFGPPGAAAAAAEAAARARAGGGVPGAPAPSTLPARLPAPATSPGMPPGAPAPAPSTAPAPAATPTPNAGMTPEELLARRRARRNQQAQ